MSPGHLTRRWERLSKHSAIGRHSAHPDGDGLVSSRQLVEHNLLGTINMLEYCRRHHAGFILLSTSRVYSMLPLVGLPLTVIDGAYRPVLDDRLTGMSEQGVSEAFPTSAPVSLYGATKLAAEQLALEYGATFDFPVWINRCGVLAGAGQFGRPDQGIFSFWIHSWRQRHPLTYVGFGGHGYQVRDCLHPLDLILILDQQIGAGTGATQSRIHNVSGGVVSARSLRQCSEWCAARFGRHEVGSSAATRVFDIPWMALDSRLATQQWQWSPTRPTDAIFEEIAQHAEANPDWLERSAP